MAENPNLVPISNISNQSTLVGQLNSNFTNISNSFSDCLSRAGTLPNQMLSQLDMNSNQIINLPAPATVNSPLRLADVSGFPGPVTINQVSAQAGTGISITGTNPVTISTSPTGSFNTMNVSVPLGSGGQVVGNSTIASRIYYAPNLNYGVQSNPPGTFPDNNALDITFYPWHGDNTYGTSNPSNANKTTFLGLNIGMQSFAAGQRACYSFSHQSYGYGDASIGNSAITFAGGQISGDEGKGFGLVSTLFQQGFLSLSTVSSVGTPSGCNTTLTQSVTGASAPQTVTVASTSGCNVGDWIVVNSAPEPVGPCYMDIEAVQITAVGSGTITAAFRNNYASGTTLTPATVLNLLASNYSLGQQRYLVNLSQPSYSTGTIASTSGGNITGSGTTWTNSMVGGSSKCIGVIALDADTYTGVPFNGSFGNANGPLYSYYPIISIASSTSMAVYGNNLASYQGYLGIGPASINTYKVRPAARILWINSTNNQVILETNTFTWTSGDLLECAICPYSAVSGFQYHVGTYTPNGYPPANSNYQSFMTVLNQGARAWSTGIVLGKGPSLGGNADSFAWDQGYVAQHCNYGFATQDSTIAGILLGGGSNSNTNNASSTIQFGNSNCSILQNPTNFGLTFGLAAPGGPPGVTTPSMTLTAFDGAVVGTNKSGILQLASTTTNYPVMFQLKEGNFANLPTASSTYNGTLAAINDANTNTPGATITAGGSTNHVLAFCKNGAWVVVV
jgi:hypothetical protein